MRREGQEAGFVERETGGGEVDYLEDHHLLEFPQPPCGRTLLAQYHPVMGDDLGTTLM